MNIFYYIRNFIVNLFLRKNNKEVKVIYFMGEDEVWGIIEMFLYNKMKEKNEFIQFSKNNKQKTWWKC